MDLIAAFLKNEAGSTAVEYGLIASLISVALIVTMQALGANLIATFETVAEALELVVIG